VCLLGIGSGTSSPSKSRFAKPSLPPSLPSFLPPSLSQAIDMTPAMGKGYQIQSFDEQGINFVILIAAGSGIAPIRAAIESEMLALKKVCKVVASPPSLPPSLPRSLPP